jgi:hypothetical protein
VFVASALSQYKDHRCLCAFVFFFGVLNVCVYMKLDCFYIVMKKKIALKKKKERRKEDRSLLVLFCRHLYLS